VQMSNNAPNITSAEVTSVNEDTDYSYTFTVSDTDSGDAVNLAAPTKPSWLSFDARSGVLSGTPRNSNVGDHSIVLSATDVAGAVTTQNFIITVNNVNDAPTVNNAISDQATAENSAFSYQFDSDVFADVDIGDSLTNTATLSDGSILPSWLKFDADTRTFSGTPLNLNVGDIAVKVTATDSSSATGSDTFNITVTNINDAPSITSSEVTSVNADTDYSYTFTASDVDSGDTVTLAAPTKPSWLSFDTLTGVLSGTPTNSNIGDHSIVLSATDVAGAVTTQNFTISVTTTLETNGDYELAHGSNNYYIIDDNDNKLGLTYYGKPLGPNKWDGWSATQVEESASGGFEVLWSHSNGETWVFKVNASGNYDKTITGRSIAENETIFEVDLDGDTHIGTPPTITLETNGDYELAHGGNKYFIEVAGSDVIYLEETGNFKLGKQGDQHYIIDADGNGIRFDMPKYAPGYFYTDTPLHVEEGLDYVGFQNDFPDGNFWVLFQRQEWASKGDAYNKGYMARKYDASGNYHGTDLIRVVNKWGYETNEVKMRPYMKYEAMFGVDLNKDGKIATGINPNNLMDISGNKHHEDDATKSVSISLKYNGKAVGSNSWDGWSATQVEESANGGYEVLWTHSGGRTWVWKADASGNYVSTINQTLVKRETTFEVDLDGDGVIGLNFRMVDIIGDYKLATAANQYHIINANDATADIISFGNISTNSDWRVKHVEASASGGYELFYVHGDGSTSVHKIDASGQYQNQIYRSIAQNEIIFKADLNGDGLDSGDNNIWDRHGIDYFDGGAGDDIINGSSGHDTLIGGEGNDRLSGDGGSGFAGNDILFGNAGNDWLRGRKGDDQFDGGTGSDTIWADTGSDKIILRIGDGGNTLSDADIIKDFTGGSDAFWLTNGLSFGDLKITQGSGDYANDTIIKYGNSEYLAILQDIDDFSLLTAGDFVDVDIA